MVDKTRKSCSHSGDLVDGWWNLEFSEPTPVTKVIVYNREDCCQERIDNTEVIKMKNFALNTDVQSLICRSKFFKLNSFGLSKCFIFRYTLMMCAVAGSNMLKDSEFTRYHVVVILWNT